MKVWIDYAGIHAPDHGMKWNLVGMSYSNTSGSKVYPPFMYITFLGFISVVSGRHLSCVSALPFNLSTQSDTYSFVALVQISFFYFGMLVMKLDNTGCSWHSSWMVRNL